MTTKSAVEPGTAYYKAQGIRPPEVFQTYFDDAAVFPPGLAPLNRAVAEHVARRGTALAAAVGPLVLPLADLQEAREYAAALDLSAGPVRVSVVTPAGERAAALAASATVAPELEICAIELKTSPDPEDWIRELGQALAIDAAETCIRIFVELTSAQIAAGALERLADTDVWLKFRVGGIHAHLFPTAEELAAVLAAAVALDIPFKLTAGLHQAVRNTNPITGITHHGFLNIAVATALALQGAETTGLETALLETDGGKLTQQFQLLTSDWRSAFLSFGTCSVAEPAESLERLGLLPAGIARIANNQKVAEQ